MEVSPRSIILVRLSALGDVLMFVPLIRTLQKHFPTAMLTWVISRPAYELVEGMEGVEFIVIDKPKGLTDYYRFYKKLKGRKFDVLLAAQASLRANLLYPLIKATRKIGYDARRAKDAHTWFVHESIQDGADHTLESFLKFGAAIGAKEPSLCWNLPITAADHAWVKAQLPGESPYLVINPAASKPERSWLVEHYIAVAKIASPRWGVKVVLTGGPSQHDRILADRILNEVPECIDLVGKTKLKQLLALIEKADAVLCPDTGPSHMASSVSTPVVALHAVTSSRVSGPYSYLEYVVDYYPQALQIFLKKPLGKQVWGTQVHHQQAMGLIPVKDVVKQLDLVFNLSSKDDA